MILHICCNLAGSSVFPQLFEAMRDSGVSQRVFVPEKYASNLGKNHPAGVETLQRLTVKRSDALLFFRKAQRSVPVIRQEIPLAECGLIHAHTLFTDGSIAMALSNETGIPYGVTLRYSDTEVLWRLPWLHPLARRILEGASFVVFLGDAVRSRVIGTWIAGEARDALQKKSTVIPNGIQPEWLDGSPRGACGNPVRVGFAGRLNDRKQPLQALEAVHLANRLPDGRFVWTACGDGPLRKQVADACRQDDRLLGPITGTPAMKAFYDSIDVLLVPSRAETFGMVYLEAMSRGVPVLYTRGQGFDGLFPEGAVGYSVACGNTHEMAEKLCLVASENYAGLSRRCVSAAAQCALPLIAERWKRLYESVKQIC